MTIIFNGGSGDNRFSAESIFPFTELFEIYGNGGNDYLVGGFLHENFIYGGIGNDQIYGGGDVNHLFGGDGNDILDSWITNSFCYLYGGSGNDYIRGGNGGGTLDGGSGADTLIGGDGGDTYVVSSTMDVVSETYVPFFDNDPNPVDTVVSSVNWTLGTNLENLVLAGTNLVNGSGNSLRNSLLGNGASNILSGNAGNDSLNGGGGSDTLIGGTGSDSYFTDGGDIIVEAVNAGIDTVQSSVTIALGLNVENLTLVGIVAINGTGNTLNNILRGNGFTNTLNGGVGIDTLFGGAGNDTYFTSGGDSIIEFLNAGIDTIGSSVSYVLGINVERLVLTGAAASSATGNTVANTIVGNTSSNVINGLLGTDRLTGGTGADFFVFNSALGFENVDQITDYSVADDTMRIENSIFLGLVAGTLAASAFAANANGSASDATDRIVYETDTGRLIFDRDGTGIVAGVQFALISPNLALSSSDFSII